MRDVVKALLSLRPGAQWSLAGNDYNDIQWKDEVQSLPTLEEVELELDRLELEWGSTEYQRLREREYPDVRVYLDGVVKNDPSQIQAYIEACLAVKAKYPKPSQSE